MMFPKEVTTDGTHGPFEMANVAAAVIDAKGTVIGWTGAAERLLGYSAAEVLDRSAATLLAQPEDASRAAEVAEECGTGESWGGLVGARHRDGHRLEVGLRVTAMSDTDDRRAWLVSAIDVSKAPTWAVSGEVLEGFLTRSPLGMAVLSPDLRYVWMNDTLERYGGVPRDQRLGRRMSDVLPGLNTEALEAQMRRVLETGEPVVDYEYRGWTWADPHREHAYSTSFFRLDGPGRQPAGRVLHGHGRHRPMAGPGAPGAAQRGQRPYRQHAGRHADRPGARRLRGAAARRLRHRRSAGIGARTGEEPGCRAGRRHAPCRCAARRSAVGPRGLPGGGARHRGRGRPSPVVAARPQSAQRRPRCWNRSWTPTPAPWVAEDPARAGKHPRVRDALADGGADAGPRHRAGRGHLLPIAATRARSSEDDLLLAEELVARAAVCVDNARRYTREHTAALTLQRSLLPQALTGGTARGGRLALPAGRRAGGVGGDWFDVIPLSGARVALVVGDVVGHGINAAATMGRLRTAVQTLADLDLPPDELLAHLDDLVIRLSGGDGRRRRAQRRPRVLGATCLYAVYDPVTRLCTMARAGHPPPAVVSPDGKVTFPDLPAGPPLGLGALPFESAEIDLARGQPDRPLHRRPDREQRPGHRRRAGPPAAMLLAQPGLPLEELCSAVVTTALLTGPQTDDVALLLARTARPGRRPGRLLGPAAGPGRRRRAPATWPSASSTGWGLDGPGDHHRADRQRTGHQRHPLRHRPDPAAPDPRTTR